MTKPKVMVQPPASPKLIYLITLQFFGFICLKGLNPKNVSGTIQDSYGASRHLGRMVLPETITL